MPNHAALTATLLAALSTSVGACAVDDADVGDTDHAIVHGQNADSAAFDAVGALAVDPDHDGRFDTFCSGTLIAPSLVLTSESCLRGRRVDQIAFLLGPKVSAPKKVLRIRGAVAEETLTGGSIGLGSDVAVLHLTSPATGVTPFPVAAITPNLVGKKLVGFGYGVRDAQGRTGVRRQGKMELLGLRGKVLELIFGSFDHFLVDGARVHFPHLDPHKPADRQRLRAIYDSLTLLEGAEGWLDDGDDAQACAGDGGGPITTKINGVDTVVGVASWTLRSCENGSAYATVGPAVLELVERETACPLIPVAGACEGTTAVRCSLPNEGPRRILRADCAELDLTCGVDDDGAVACVDPCDGIPESGVCEGDVAVRCSLDNEGPRRVLRADSSNLFQACGFEGGAVACVDRR